MPEWEPIKIGKIGTDARTLKAAIQISHEWSMENKGDPNRFKGVVIRGPGVTPQWIRENNLNVGYIPAEHNVDSYAEVTAKGLKDGELDCAFSYPEQIQYDGLLSKILKLAPQYVDKVAGLFPEGTFLEERKIKCHEEGANYGIPFADEWKVYDLYKETAQLISKARQFQDWYGGGAIIHGEPAGGKGTRPYHTNEEIPYIIESLQGNKDYQANYKKYYPNGKRPVLLESLLTGYEVSPHIALDGNGTWKIFSIPVDFPTVASGPTGINNKQTGGMGTIGPHPADTPELRWWINNHVMPPLVKMMKAKRILRPCFIYLALFVQYDKYGRISSVKVSEINIRPGEPEAQFVAGITRNFNQICWATICGNLDQVEIDVFKDQFYVSMALVTGRWNSEKPGYPDSSRKGDPIKYRTSKNVGIIPSAWDMNHVAGPGRVAYLDTKVSYAPKSDESPLRAKIRAIREAQRRIEQGYQFPVVHIAGPGLKGLNEKLIKEALESTIEKADDETAREVFDKILELTRSDKNNLLTMRPNMAQDFINMLETHPASQEAA